MLRCFDCFSKSHLFAIFIGDDCSVSWMRLDMHFNKIRKGIKYGDSAPWRRVKPMNDAVARGQANALDYNAIARDASFV